MQHLVYLHGFLSSSQSEKAQLTYQFAKRYYPSLNIHMPNLSGDIFKTLAQLESLVRTLPMQQTGFIGSSMGGFLSTYLLEHYGKPSTRAVIVNPAVEPHQLLNKYRGRHINPNTQEVFYINERHIEKLAHMYVPSLMQASQYKVLLQTADETLDYRLALRKYGHKNCIVEQGGDHSFQGYQRYLSDIFSFLIQGR